MREPSLDLFLDARRKSRYDSEAMLEDGTLQDLLDAVDEGLPYALNCLELPLGGKWAPTPPRFADFTTETYARPLVRELIYVKDMGNTLSWATAATRNAVSWPHIDDDGFGTTVMVQAGKKIWIMLRLKERDEEETGTTEAFRTWTVDKIDEISYEAEGVHLDATCAL